MSSLAVSLFRSWLHAYMESEYMFGHVLSCSDKTSLLLFMLKDAQRRRYGSIECFFFDEWIRDEVETTRKWSSNFYDSINSTQSCVIKSMMNRRVLNWAERNSKEKHKIQYWSCQEAKIFVSALPQVVLLPMMNDILMSLKVLERLIRSTNHFCNRS